MKNRKQRALLLCFFCIIGMLILSAHSDAKSMKHAKTVNAVVKYSRKIYYGTNRNLKKCRKECIKGEYTDYWKNNKLVKAITYPTSTSDSYVKKYTVEYYYDKNHHLVFAFAYKKTRGKIKEYRAYYGTDGKLYRYIDATGKVYSYKGGKKIKYSSKSLKYLLYNKGSYYLALAMEGM